MGEAVGREKERERGEREISTEIAEFARKQFVPRGNFFLVQSLRPAFEIPAQNQRQRTGTATSTGRGTRTHVMVQVHVQVQALAVEYRDKDSKGMRIKRALCASVNVGFVEAQPADQELHVMRNVHGTATNVPAAVPVPI